MIIFLKSLLALIVIGGVVGLIGNYGLRKRLPGDWWGAIVIAFVGAGLGALILQTWKWLEVGGINVFHAIIGAVVVTYLVSIFSKPR